jgi:hypothetical protein
MKRILLAFLLTFSTALFAAGSIGSVSENKGNNCQVERGKAKLSGIKGANIESMDTYTTGVCVSTLTFTDDTKVKVNENSRLLIDDFVFDPKKSDAGKLALKIGMGTVRYASGQIAKNNPQQVAINTPTATISVRGTDFSMTVDETGQSLVILLPSCKEEKEQKQYEIDEQRCKIGSIVVETQAGKVIMDQAFQATFVSSAQLVPTRPVIVNTIESKIGNNLILIRPQEVQIAMDAEKERERKKKEEEEERARSMAEAMKKKAEEIEKARLLLEEKLAGVGECNPATNICVRWENDYQENVKYRGDGVAYRITEGFHIAEVKTEGWRSNTSVTITHNYNVATEMIGDRSGNVIKITQNAGFNRR